MRDVKPGVRVRLRGFKRTAKVYSAIHDVKGGVALETPLRGFYCWNVRDLELARPQGEP
jgi:hypothetical protein